MPAGGLTAIRDGQTVNPDSPTASSCRIGACSGADGTSSPATTKEDTNDDLLDYEPSPTHNGMEVNVVYLSSTDYSLLEEEEVSQLALGIRRSSEADVHSWSPGWHASGPHVG
jgi:hypothetical protein